LQKITTGEWKNLTLNTIDCTQIIQIFASGRDEQAIVELLNYMETHNICLDEVAYISTLSDSALLKAESLGRRIHAHLKSNTIRQSVSLQNALLNMYSKCGCADEVLSIFYDLQQHNANIDQITWTIVITTCAQNGKAKEALNFFKQMQDGGIQPDFKTYTSVLLACSKSGNIDEARTLFDDLCSQQLCDAVTWSTMIAGYVQNERPEEAINLYMEMQKAGVKPDATVFASLFSACAELSALTLGKELQQHANLNDTLSLSMMASLLNMYVSSNNHYTILLTKPRQNVEV
jgi:pentatricopeptide repeat protein